MPDKIDAAELWDEHDRAAPIPGERNKLYELDGLPIRFSNNPLQFPERWSPKNKSWEPFHSMTRIAFEASPLSKEKFTALCRQLGATE